MATVEIVIGPQHPALKEPGSFKVKLSGERIVGFDYRLGYNHRGIEKAAEQRNYIQNLYLLERICGICSHSHTSCFIAAVEEIAKIEVPLRARYLRVLIGELERLHSHLLWLGVAGHEIGFDTLLMYSWRDRELVMDLLAALTGNRVNYGFNVLGGVKRDLSAPQRTEVLKVIAALEARTRYYIEVASEETTLIQRLSKVGYLSREDVLRLGTVGPTARASDVPRDTRRDDPYLVYAEIPFDVVTDSHGDVYGRTLVRVGELMQSYRIIRHICENLPEGPIAPKKVPRKIPAGEALSRYEAPRGEDVHYVRANGTERPERVKIRAPTLCNLQSVPRMLEANSLADVPITLAAIDPCFSCTDRMIELCDPEGRPRSQLTWEQLRLAGIEHYRRQGVDLAVAARRWRRRAEEGSRR